MIIFITSWTKLGTLLWLMLSFVLLCISAMKKIFTKPHLVVLALCVATCIYLLVITLNQRHWPHFIKSYRNNRIVPLNCKEVEVNSSKKYFPQIHRHESKRVTKKLWELSVENTKVDDVGYYMNPSRLCKTDNIYIAFLTWSAPNSSEVRDAVRATWAGIKSYKGRKLVHIFVLATHSDPKVMERVHKENERHNDILMFDFIDSYLGMTHKTLSTYRWALRYCANVKYIARATDDIFLSYKKLFFHILPLRETRIYFGCGEDLYVDLHTFLSGVFILSSIDVVRDMFLLSCKTPHIFPDDVYLGILAEMLGLQSRGRNIIFCGQPLTRAEYYNYKPLPHFKQDMLREGGYRYLFHLGSTNTTASTILELWKEMKLAIFWPDKRIISVQWLLKNSL